MNTRNDTDKFYTLDVILDKINYHTSSPIGYKTNYADNKRGSDIYNAVMKSAVGATRKMALKDMNHKELGHSEIVDLELFNLPKGYMYVILHSVNKTRTQNIISKIEISMSSTDKERVYALGKSVDEIVSKYDLTLMNYDPKIIQPFLYRRHEDISG